MTESEMIDESIERVRDNTRYVLTHEKSADAVLTKVSGMMMQLVGAYKFRGVCPTRRELEDCCAMILAIGRACDAKPI